MTRKDYSLIADALNVSFRATGSKAHRETIRAAAEILAYRIQASNPNFNPARFMAAVEKEVSP